MPKKGNVKKNVSKQVKKNVSKQVKKNVSKQVKKNVSKQVKKLNNNEGGGMLDAVNGIKNILTRLPELVSKKGPTASVIPPSRPAQANGSSTTVTRDVTNESLVERKREQQQTNNQIEIVCPDQLLKNSDFHKFWENTQKLKDLQATAHSNDYYIDTFLSKQILEVLQSSDEYKSIKYVRYSSIEDVPSGEHGRFSKYEGSIKKIKPNLEIKSIDIDDLNTFAIIEKYEADKGNMLGMRDIQTETRIKFPTNLIFELTPLIEGGDAERRINEEIAKRISSAITDLKANNSHKEKQISEIESQKKEEKRKIEQEREKNLEAEATELSNYLYKKYKGSKHHWKDLVKDSLNEFKKIIKELKNCEPQTGEAQKAEAEQRAMERLATETSKNREEVIPVPEWVRKNNENSQLYMHNTGNTVPPTIKEWQERERERREEWREQQARSAEIEAGKTPEQRAAERLATEIRRNWENKIKEFTYIAIDKLENTKEGVVVDGVSLQEFFKETEYNETDRGKGINQLTSEIDSEINTPHTKYTDEQIVALIELNLFLSNRLAMGEGMYHEKNNNIKISRDIINRLPKKWQPIGWGGGRTNKKLPKKEILGKMICIYKIPGDRKEYVRHKGKLITVKDYKELMKAKKAKKAN